MVKDFVGKELNIGDEVVFMMRNYRSLLKGTIIKLTPKNAVIKHEKDSNYSEQTMQFFSQIVKI